VFDAFDSIWIFYLCIFGAVIAAIDAVYSLAFKSTMYRKDVNKRLRRLEAGAGRTATLIDLRRDRGLAMDGSYRLPVVRINRLIVQSGVQAGLWRLGALAGGAALAGAGAGYAVHGLALAGPGALIGGLVLPVCALLYLRRRRRARFTDQFAEAIDIIVRSLRAGHPVPSAIKLAAKELPDPIGTEFGLVEDELTFGLDLEAALRNLQERVGQEDLPLFVTSIAIQTQSGGNLTEILDNLCGVIRQRAKMRRKIRALSAEGRISAIILSSTPIALFAIINTLSPSFYTQHMDHPWMTYGLAGAAVWMLIGNLWMRKMINFRL